MGRKSFKGNPAVQFISTVEEEVIKEREQDKTAEKSLCDYKLNPMYIEKKSRRLQLILQPSLYARVKEKAQQRGISVNEYIHKILEEATREEI